MVRCRAVAVALLVLAATGCTTDGATGTRGTRAAVTPSAALSTVRAPAVGAPTASAAVAVGPGSVESSLRQVVRTSEDRVWIAAIDDDGGQSASPPFPVSHLHLWRGATTGTPASFAVVDAGHEPTTPAGSPMSGPDARLDRSGHLHVVYYRGDTGRCVHQVADLGTGRWGAAEDAAPGGAPTSPPSAYYGLRGAQVCALTLLADDRPVVLVAGGTGVTTWARDARGWRREATLDPGPAVHPALVTDRQGRVHAAWLEGDRAVRWALRAADGSWAPAETVASGGDVQADDNLDQSPSLVVDGTDRPVVLWLSGHPGGDDSLARVARRTAPATWVRLDPATYTHTPGLHARGDDLLMVLGHDAQIHPAWQLRPAGATAWGPSHAFLPTGSYDGSASTRFDPLRDPSPAVVDVVYFDENSDARQGHRPDLYYATVTLPSAG